jgi:hypothetical protein
MATNGTPIQEANVPRKKKADIPLLVIPKNATLKQIYARARAEFTAADLQKYTEIEPMVPFEQVLADMERIHEEEMERQRKAQERQERSAGRTEKKPRKKR